MNANALLSDIDVGHQVGLGRYSAATSRKLLGILKTSEDDVVRQLREAGWEDVTRESARVARLEKVLEGIRQTQREAYGKAGRTLRSDLLELAPYETGFQAKAVQQATAARIQAADLSQPKAEDLRAAIDGEPFQGRELKEWGDDLRDAAFRRVRDAVRIGYTDGQGVASIVSTIKGTAAARFKDGIDETGRRDVEGLVRTAVTHTAQQAKSAFFAANPTIFRGERWNAVLDNRTTAVCRGRDGKVYPLEEGPRPPAHWRCRSTTTGVLHGEPDAPDGDTYGAWLARQDRETQDQVLGSVKVVLWRDGGLKLDRFIDDTGAEYTLEELNRRESAAFTRAGVAL